MPSGFRFNLIQCIPKFSKGNALNLTGTVNLKFDLDGSKAVPLPNLAHVTDHRHAGFASGPLLVDADRLVGDLALGS